MPIPGVTVEDVDAYSDVSNGSTISVGSAASGGGGHMPRPPTGDSRRSKSMQGRRSRVAKSPYSSSQLKGSSKQQPPKPTARNMWITAMRNGTALSTENSPMKTWAGPMSSYNKQMKTGTRARHLSDFVPTEDLKSKNHVRSASMSASQPQLTGGGGPAYKPQEDYYDEIIELKKIINALKAENNVINTKLHRVEGENVLKDRKMEDLLNNRKQPEDVRRTLTDKKGDTSAIVNSLKQKLHAVERTVKDKEAELSQLKKDIKMTNIEELQIQSETYYQEVQRLQLAVLEMQQSQVHDHYGRASSPRGSKGKPSTLTLQRLAEENDHLKAENRSLKKDLLTAIENSSSGNKKVTLKTEYADMNRGQLLAKIHELEEKVQDSDGKKTFPRKGSLHEDKEADVEGRRKSISKLTEVPGRIELRGTTSQKLTQLQEREVELLEEREKQREIIERLKEDRAHYRSVADDLRLQLKSTQDELDRLGGEKGAVGERRRSSTSLSSLRRLSLKESRPRGDNDDDLDRMLNDFQQQRAAKALQRQWRGYRGRKQQAIQDEEMEKNKAAVTLQKNWRRHRNRTKQVDDESKEEAITEIQAALRGQAVRNKYLEQLDKDLEMTDRDDAIVAIQSAMRGHWARKKHLGGPGDELASRDTRTRGSSSHILLGSEPESDDDLVIISSSGKRHPEPAMTSPRRRSLTDPQESTERVVLAASPRHVAAIERNPVLARDKALESAKVARGQEYAPAPLARDKALVPTALPRGKALPRNHELAHNEGRDSSSALARDKTPVPKALPRGKANARDETLARDQTREQFALARDQSKSDSDDDAVVIGRSARSRTGNQKKEKTHLNLNKSVERNQRTSDVNKKDLLEENAKKSRGKKKAAKESAKNEIEDGTEENNKTEGSRRLISAPRFSNISELSEDEDSSPTRSKSNQNRFGGLRNEFAHKETEQRPKKKNFEIVDSDDDDDDDAVISRPRRTLDTGMSRQQPSLSRSNRPISPPGTSESRPGLSRSSRGVSPPDTSEDRVRTIESRSGLSRSSRGVSPPDTSEDRVRTIESRPGSSRSSRGISATNDDRVKSVGGRPGLSRASGNLAAKRDVDDSDSGMEESSQRPGLSRSKRPLSGQRPGLSRSGSRDKEKESPRASGSGRSRMLADSEEDSDEDDVIITGKKTKNTDGDGDGKAGGRPSLTRKSPASALPASSQRNTLASSLDNFFSKGSSGKKSPRKTHPEVQESDDDDDDDDMVVSSLSKYKSKQKEPSRDSVAGLWATSDKGSDSNKRKSSVKSSKRNTWSPDFGFEKPARRPDSRLDELF